MDPTLLALAILHLPMNGTGRNILTPYATWSSDSSRHPRRQASFEGSYLDAYLSQAVSEGWLMRYGIWGDLVAADNSRYFHQNGALLAGETFDSTFLGLKSGLWRKADKGELEVSLSATAGRKWSVRGKDTSADFLLPLDHWGAWLELGLGWDPAVRRSLGELVEGPSVRSLLRGASRNPWRGWGPPQAPHPDEGRYYLKEIFDASYGAVWRDHHCLKVAMRLAAGSRLDPLSSFAVGSSIPGSDFILVPGTYFAEHRSEFAWGVSASYSLDLHERLRVEAGLNAAYLQEVRFPMTPGVGFKARLKTFQGLPVLAAYGYAPRARRGESLGGHELTLITGVAF